MATKGRKKTRKTSLERFRTFILWCCENKPAINNALLNTI